MTEAKDHRSVVVDTSASPFARLKPVPVGSVKLTDGVWAPRRRVNCQVTLPAQYRHLEETGRVDNFRRASGKVRGPFQGLFFNDSDVYKWLEAASWALADDAAPGWAKLAAKVDALIVEVAAAQQPDGYLNTYFMFERAAERWSNLRDLHELYCVGHLIQAAVAHHRATGSGLLLGVAMRLADHVCATFGPSDSGKRPGVCGHEEIEMALVELARDTGVSRYLDQARYFLDARGQGLIGGSEYHQDHIPFRQLERMTGHAVRAVYLNAGAADIHAETGDSAIWGALSRLWHNMTTRQMYISGGIGSRYEGEAFSKDYELPNERAYTETCAAIGSVMWNWRMLAASGNAQYADLVETTLYNAVLPGLSLDGKTYFYQNPLGDDGSHRRQPWFGCACCPPNIARLLASLPGYAYSVSAEGLWIHLYAEGTATVVLPDGRVLALAQETHYPWEGQVGIRLVSGEGSFALFMRIPAWCVKGGSIRVNGHQWERTPVPGSYIDIQRSWQPGDHVELDLPMPPRWMVCHPHVPENLHRVALMRGPLLYCVEQVDHRGVDPRDIVVSPQSALSARFRPDLLGGLTVIRGQAELVPLGAAWTDHLYQEVADAASDARGRTIKLTAIPYYAWANREPGCMQVWLRTR